MSNAWDELLENLRRFWKTIFESLVSSFKKLLESILDYKPFIEFGEKALSIARQEILALDELDDWTNDQKRNAAFENIGSRLKTAGISFGTQWLNTLIELVLMEIRKAEDNK